MSQGIGYPRGGGNVSDIVWRTGARAFQGLESGGRDADHGVAAGQPNTADRLTPEGLGFDDLTELPVARAVVPIALCEESHHFRFLDPNSFLCFSHVAPTSIPSAMAD